MVVTESMISIAECVLYLCITIQMFDCEVISNKKVLLRERKRHTARRVVSTPSVVLPGYPPRGGT